MTRECQVPDCPQCAQKAAEREAMDGETFVDPSMPNGFVPFYPTLSTCCVATGTRGCCQRRPATRVETPEFVLTDPQGQTCDQPHPNSAEHRCYLPAGHGGAHFATMSIPFTSVATYICHHGKYRHEHMCDDHADYAMEQDERRKP